MSRPSPLPDAAREQAWRLLWQRLLQPIPDDAEPAPEPEPRPDKAATEDSAVA